MKKFLYLISLITCFYGCVQNPKKITDQKRPFLLKTYLDSIVKTNLNLSDNDITMANFSDSLKLGLQKYRGDSLPFLSELPLQYSMMMQYPISDYDKNSGKFVVKFEFGTYTSECTLSNNYQTSFIVFSIVDKTTASKLVNNSLYHIKGVFKDFANCEGSFTLPSGKCIEKYPNVSMFDGKPDIDLGTLIIENAEFIPYK